MMSLARDNEALLLQPRRDFGDIFTNEPFAFSFCDGKRFETLLLEVSLPNGDASSLQEVSASNAGCSWVVYEAPLAPSHSGNSFEHSVDTFLPAGVDAVVEAWLVKHWWTEDARPETDGFYGDAPS